MDIEFGRFRISSDDLRRNLGIPLVGSPFEEGSPYRQSRCPDKPLDAAVALYFQDIAGKEGDTLVKSWEAGKLFKRKPYCDPNNYLSRVAWKLATSKNPAPISFDRNSLRLGLVECSHIFYTDYFSFFLGIYALDILALVRSGISSLSFNQAEWLCNFCNETASQAKKESSFPDVDWEAFKKELFAITIPAGEAE
ncbi:MAG: hypothetical protein LUC43_00650 [Burkholderiales bacterium]|nr:hypothetical protein [Burkholderiales bacterium]